MDKNEKLDEIYNRYVMLESELKKLPPLERIIAVLITFLTCDFGQITIFTIEDILKLFDDCPATKSRIKKKLMHLKNTFIDHEEDLYEDLHEYAEIFDTTIKDFLTEAYKKYGGEGSDN